MRSLREKLAAISSAPPKPKTEAPPKREKAFFVRDTRYPLAEIGGIEHTALEQVQRVDPLFTGGAWDARRAVFLDTETTGLSGGAYYMHRDEEMESEAQERFYKNKTVEPLYKLRPEVSKNFSDIIEKAMAIDAKKRYRDVASMLADLDDETSVVLPPFSEPEKKSILNFWQKRKKNKIYFLQIIGGPFDGYLFPFPKDGRLTVGRNNQKCNAVMPPVDIISRRHCTIELDNRNSIITITDHSSTGTYRANGDRLPKEMPVVIPISEEFFLADRQYTMQIIAVDG